MAHRISFFNFCSAIALASTSAILSTPVQAATSYPAGWSEIASRTLPATVNIQVSKVAMGSDDPDTGEKTTPGERSQFYGSGFIVDESGVIVTNKHVVNGALAIVVTLQDGTQTMAKIIGMAQLIDLALLKIDVGHPLPKLTFSDGDAARPGDPVLAIGDPLGVGTSLSAGIVSGTQRNLMNSPFDDYVQTDAAINHGNSGGPLVDASGNVIGVNSILYTNEANEGSNGVGFSISSTIAKVVVNVLLHQSDKFGWIGAHLQDLMPDLSRALGTPPLGAIITEVESGGSASASGLRPGDVIQAFDEKPLATARALMLSIATAPIGSEHVVQYWSKGSVRSTKMIIQAWHKDSGDDSDDSAPKCASPPQADLGLLLESITPLNKALYNITDSSGLVVAAVDPASEAYGRGFRPGIVIQQINDQPVTTTQAARLILEKAATSSPVVAFLVDWSKGPSWFVLHTGYIPGDQTAMQDKGTCVLDDSGSSSDQATARARDRFLNDPR